MFYGRRRRKDEYALLHLLERVSARELTDNILEDELREIIVDREDIEQDLFDDLIKEAEIIDIEGPETIEEVIRKVAGRISDKTNMDEDEFISRFLTRQKVSNICFTDFSAIHHIVIEGKDKIFLIIIRSKNGIKFNKNKNEIKVVFLLGGTRDKKIPQFEALDCLASLTERDNFRERWLSTDNKVKLKNILALSNRERFSG